MDKTWNKLLRYGAMALVMTMIVLVGISLPVTVAEAATTFYKLQFLQDGMVEPNVFLSGTTISKDNVVLQGQDANDTWHDLDPDDYTVDFSFVNNASVGQNLGIGVTSNNADYIFNRNTVTVTIKQNLTKDQVGVTVDTIDFGQTLSNTNLRITGTQYGRINWASGVNTDGVLSAGKHTITAKFTPNGEYICPVDWPDGIVQVTVTVNKAEINVDDIKWPTYSLVYEQTQADCQLEWEGRTTGGSYSWKTPSTEKIPVGVNWPSMIFTTDSNHILSNGNTTCSGVATVSVKKKYVQPAWPAQANPITYGKPVSDSIATPFTDKYGTFTWNVDDGSAIPEVGSTKLYTLQYELTDANKNNYTLSDKNDQSVAVTGYTIPVTPKEFDVIDYYKNLGTDKNVAGDTTITFGDSLSDIKLTNATVIDTAISDDCVVCNIVWANPDATIEAAGEVELDVMVDESSINPNYTVMNKTGKIKVNVARQKVKPEFPTLNDIYYGASIGSSLDPATVDRLGLGEFTVVNPGTIPSGVGPYAVPVKYTLSQENQANYIIGDGEYLHNDSQATMDININVLPALVTPKVPVASNDIVYGQTLADVKLDPAKDGLGTYSWKDANAGDIIPEACVDEGTKRSYTAVYTLDDNVNYQISGDYEWDVAFYVEPTVIDGINLDGYNTYIYDGDNHKQTIMDHVKVYCNNNLLSKGVDYDITITDKDGANADVIESGEYTVTATAKGDKYRESISTTVTVEKAELIELKLTKDSSDYDRNVIDPKTLAATVKANNGKDAVDTACYELVCDEEIRDVKIDADGSTVVGYTITVKLKPDGEKNFIIPADQPTATYTVKPVTITSFKLAEDSWVYDQAPHKDFVTNTLNAEVTAGELPLYNGSDENTAEFKLTVDGEVQDVNTYTVTAEPVSSNFTGSLTKDVTITAATVDFFELKEKEGTYNRGNFNGSIVEGITAKAGELELNEGEYNLTIDANIVNADKYEIILEGTGNYQGKKTQTFTVNPAPLYELTLTKNTRVYNQQKHNAFATDIKNAAVTASEGALVLNDTNYPEAVDEFELTVEGDVLDADTYTVTAKPKSKNFSGSATAEFIITPAQVKELTLGVTRRIYDQQPVDLTKLDPEVTATANGEEIITLPYGGENPAYSIVFPEGTVQDADEYMLQIELIDNKNYEGNATAKFEVEPAEVNKLELGVTTSVYNRVAVDLTSLQPTVTALTNDGATITLPYGDENAAYIIAGEEAVNVGEYVFHVELVDDVNYIMPEDVTDDYTITRLRVKPLSFISTVTNSAGEYVLGGPVAAGNRTITINGEPNELVYVVVNGSQTSESLRLNENGIATLTVTGDGAEGTLNLGEGIEVTLDGSGSGQTFTVKAVYGDASNLSDSEEDANPATPQAGYRYDMEAMKVTVAQLFNRAESGIKVDLPEDLASISFNSNSGAGVAFSGSAQGLVLGEGKTIAFNGTNKLNSTEFDPESVYDVTYTDLVGNTGAVLGQTVAKSSGTLKIDAVAPALNSNKRIGQTGTITWTITCTSTGGNDENVRLTIGGTTFTGTLKQGSNTFAVSAGALRRDSLLNVNITFEDLLGSGTFESFVYDDHCDEPVLTSELYAECYVITGIVEPGARVRIRVNGENVSCKVDSFGVFAAEMPVVYEGDKVEIIVTDLADNITKKTVIVGPGKDIVRMKAYMLGKIFTNAHDAKNGEAIDWTSITTITEEELLAGKVNLPIVAGNMTQVGTMTMTLDENGGISYDYELNDGVALVSEDVRVNATRSKDDALNHTGTLLSRGSATQVSVKKGQYYVTAEFVVDVSADQLTSTFQLQSVAESELKLIYRDRQNNKPIK